MKHAAAKEKSARRIAKTKPSVPVGKEEKVVKDATILPFKKAKTTATKSGEPIAKETNAGKKILRTVVAEPKIKTAKVAVGAATAEKTGKKKSVAPVLIKKSPAKKEKKTAAVAAAASKPKLEKKKTESSVVDTENKAAKKSIVPAKNIQKVKLSTGDALSTTSPVKVSSEVQKIKAAVNIGRINAALKAIEAAQAKAINIEKADRKRLKAAARKSKIVEAMIEETAAIEKTKPKNVKPIGAAVFRGRKTRYDFQVYPLDFEFENVPGIYVISRRKTDSKKRGHHALVCIGQTESISGELKKHTQGECVKKHEANAVSILPEENEKKRLKIEEDLKAAHAIACNPALE